MNCFVISLDNAVDRRKHIEREFDQAQLSFTFFDALKPVEAKQALLKISDKCDLSRLSPGEIACLASHVVLWKMLIDTNQKYYIIFEDDVFVGENVVQFLNEITFNLEGMDLIKLETFHEKVLLGELKRTIGNRGLYDLKSGHSGTAGYLVTRDGAEKLLSYLLTDNQIMPADHYIFEEVSKKNKLNTFQVKPALCIQEKVLLEDCSLSNSLDQARDNWVLIKKNKSIFARIIKEFHRFILRQKLKYFSIVVEFK